MQTRAKRALHGVDIPTSQASNARERLAAVCYEDPGNEQTRSVYESAMQLEADALALQKAVALLWNEANAYGASGGSNE